jgi:hypothetical protein
VYQLSLTTRASGIIPSPAMRQKPRRTDHQLPPPPPPPPPPEKPPPPNPEDPVEAGVEAIVPAVVVLKLPIDAP